MIDEELQQELTDLEERVAKVILKPSQRALSVAAIMNWLMYGRWPGEGYVPKAVEDGDI